MGSIMALDSKEILFSRIEFQTGELTLIRLLFRELTTSLVCVSAAKLSRLFTIKYLQPEITKQQPFFSGESVYNLTFQ